ncbi:hypothetical protein D9M71_739000 [compost metagenome]
MAQARQLGGKDQAVAGQAPADLRAAEGLDLAVDAGAVVKIEEGGVIELGVQVEVGPLADQVDDEAVRPVEGFQAAEAEHLHRMAAAGQAEGEAGGVGAVHGAPSIGTWVGKRAECGRGAAIRGF